MGKVIAGFAGLVLGIIVLLLMLGGQFQWQQQQHGCGQTGSGSTGTSAAGGGDRLAPPGSFVKPVDPSTVTESSPYGPRDGAFHHGIDLAGPVGTPIYAAADGIVVAAGPATGFGNWIVIDHQIPGVGLESTVYGHMYDDGVLVHTGDTVRAGQHIANIGSNGQATGPHLHFEIWPGGRISGGHDIDPQAQYDAAPAPGTTGGGGAPAQQVAAQQPSASTTAAAPSSPGSAASSCGGSVPGQPGPGGAVNLGTVPPQYLPWLQKAASMCPQITASLLAAQINQESGFNAQAVSSTGAQGPAQFMPGTWPNYGRDDDGNGTSSPFDIGDAVMAQARYMCAIATTIEKAITDGKVKAPNGATELYLAAYNAGEQAVLSSGGFPTGSPDYETQTRPYAAKILASEPSYRAAVAATQS